MENDMGITCTVNDRNVKIYFNGNLIITLEISDNVSDPENFNSSLATHLITTVYNLNIYDIIDADLSQYINDCLYNGYGNGDEDTLDEYKSVFKNIKFSNKYFEEVY